MKTQPAKVAVARSAQGRQAWWVCCAQQRSAAGRAGDDSAFEHVSDLLAGVDGILEPLKDVLPADHHHRIDAGLEQRGESGADQPIALVLQAADFI